VPRKSRSLACGRTLDRRDGVELVNAETPATALSTAFLVTPAAPAQTKAPAPVIALEREGAPALRARGVFHRGDRRPWNRERLGLARHVRELAVEPVDPEPRAEVWFASERRGMRRA
jgi:hypothetical protein